MGAGSEGEVRAGLVRAYLGNFLANMGLDHLGSFFDARRFEVKTGEAVAPYDGESETQAACDALADAALGLAQAHMVAKARLREMREAGRDVRVDGGVVEQGRIFRATDEALSWTLRSLDLLLRFAEEGR